MSKIPFITFEDIYTAGQPSSPDGYARVRVNLDTAVMSISFTDGDADLGTDPKGGNPFINIKDLRDPANSFTAYPFPGDIPLSIEDPKKGVTGVCTFYFIPAILSPRTDSIHLNIADTVRFQVFITDRKGNRSDTITTTSVIILP